MVITQPEHLRLPLPLSEITDICRNLGIQELAVFGSALREDFRADSDVDFLVVFDNGDAGDWGGKYDELAQALTIALGRSVDVVGRESIEKSENYLRRRHILSSAKTIYVA